MRVGMRFMGRLEQCEVGLWLAENDWDGALAPKNGEMLSRFQISCSQPRRWAMDKQARRRSSSRTVRR